MRVLILGSNGMAGHVIHLYLKDNTNWDIIGLKRPEFEVDIGGSWKHLILKLNKKEKIDYIINCIGVLREQSAKDPILAIRVNSLFPHELASLAGLINCKIIHFSTDCWNDLDVYGRSKRAGELDYTAHLTIRTSIVGPEIKNNGTGLFNWFMNQNKIVCGFVDHLWDGVTTLELAKQIRTIINSENSFNHIKNLRTKDKTNKFELLKLFKEEFKKNIELIPKKTDKVDKTVKNPELIVNKSYSDQIKEMKIWITSHKKLYSYQF